MRLYHGSNVAVKEPKLLPQTRGLDFGAGFYATSNKAQAEDFTVQVARRTKTATRFVTVYEYDDARASKQLAILRFQNPESEWLEFVRQNRQLAYTGAAYDLVVGPVANDDVFATLQTFFAGLLTREQTLDALKIKKLYDQYVFKTENALAYLRQIDAYIPKGE